MSRSITCRTRLLFITIDLTDSLFALIHQSSRRQSKIKKLTYSKAKIINTAILYILYGTEIVPLKGNRLIKGG